MPAPSLPFFSAPLADVLQSIESRLKCENVANVIVATAKRSELRKDDLPPHVQVASRPLKGPRVGMRNGRHFKQTRVRVAHYPQSRMSEEAVPLLLCVIRGMANIHIGNYKLQCRPGDFIFIPPMVPKGDFSHAEGDNLCDVLHIYPGQLLGEGLECWIAHSQGDKIETGARLGSALFKNVFLASLFDQLGDEMRRSPSSEITYLLLRGLVILLLRELWEDRVSKTYTKQSHQLMEPMRDPMKHALMYIEAHLGAPLTIAGMARETALSPTNFKLLFRRATGQPFHQYLTLSRLKFAGKLLRETDLKIQDIAERIGLSPNRLNRLFQDQFSCSPGEYRKQK
jgi:AraC-like DNA-binding protein